MTRQSLAVAIACCLFCMIPAVAGEAKRVDADKAKKGFASWETPGVTGLQLHASTSRTTFPYTSVSRKSRPA